MTLSGVSHLLIDLRRNMGGRDQQAQIAARLLSNKSQEWFRYRHVLPGCGRGTTSPTAREGRPAAPLCDARGPPKTRVT
jgi:hypothetical protein